jgi:hypothetical protein
VLRQFRAVLSISLIWAAAWLPMGLALGLYAGATPPQPSDIIWRPVSLPLFLTAWTVWGAVSGGFFALILRFTERRRTADDLTLIRTAIWGAAGAMTLPAALVVIDAVRTPSGLLGYTWRFPLLVLAASAALGAGCAAATLALARRAPG